MYTALGIDIERVSGPAKVAPPTQVPLWYLFDSEREVINNCALPSTPIFSNFCLKREYVIVLVIILVSFSQHTLKLQKSRSANVSHWCFPIGELQNWDDGLSAALIHQSASIHSAVGRAAYQLSDYCVPPEIGRCKCSAIKTLHYGWHTTPIPHPSFFWGCCRYSISDAVMHDKGIPLSDSLWKVLEADDQIGRVSDRDLLLLTQKVNTAMLFWKDHPADILFEHALKFYGGPEMSPLSKL